MARRTDWTLVLLAFMVRYSALWKGITTYCRGVDQRAISVDRVVSVNHRLRVGNAVHRNPALFFRLVKINNKHIDLIAPKGLAIGKSKFRRTHMTQYIGRH